ncbi:hypothetical protein JCM12107_14020 [Corynebacterium simulans]
MDVDHHRQLFVVVWANDVEMQAILSARDAILPRIDRLRGYWTKVIALAYAFPTGSFLGSTKTLGAAGIGAEWNAPPRAHGRGNWAICTEIFFPRATYPAR